MNLLKFKNKSIWVVGVALYSVPSTVKMLLKSDEKKVLFALGKKVEDFGVSMKADENIIPVSVDLRDGKKMESFVQHCIQKYRISEGLVVLTFGSPAKSLKSLSVLDFNNLNRININLADFQFCCSENDERGVAEVLSFFRVWNGSTYPGIYKSPMNMNPIEYVTGKARVIQMPKHFMVYYAKKMESVSIVFLIVHFSIFLFKKNILILWKDLNKKYQRQNWISKRNFSSNCFLLSDLASFITRHNFIFGEGWICW